MTAANSISPIDAVLEASPLARFARYMDATEETDGWFNAESAALWDALLGWQTTRRIKGHMLEIGVWHGKSAALMAMHADADRTCMLVDIKIHRARIESALERLGLRDSIEVSCLQCNSRELVTDPLITEGFRGFRWIHIDGEHTGGAVSSDLAIAANLLADGGVVVIDDFFSWLYPQITEAVLRYLRSYPDDFSMFLCGYNKAYLARPHFVHEYMELCAGSLCDELEQRGIEPTLSRTTYPAEMNTFGIGNRFQGARLRGPDWEPGVIRY